MPQAHGITITKTYYATTDIPTSSSDHQSSLNSPESGCCGGGSSSDACCNQSGESSSCCKNGTGNASFGTNDMMSELESLSTSGGGGVGGGGVEDRLRLFEQKLDHIIRNC